MCKGLYLQERSKREDQSLSAHINHNPNAKHWDFLFSKRKNVLFQTFLKQKMCTMCKGLYLQERSKREDQSLSVHINHNPNAKYWDFLFLKDCI